MSHPKRGRLIGCASAIAAVGLGLAAGKWWTPLPAQVAWRIHWRGTDLTLPVDGAGLVLRPGESVDVHLLFRLGGQEFPPSAPLPVSLQADWQADAGDLRVRGDGRGARWVYPRNGLARRPAPTVPDYKPDVSTIAATYTLSGWIRAGSVFRRRVQAQGKVQLTCWLAQRQTDGRWRITLPPDQADACLSPWLRVRDWVPPTVGAVLRASPDVVCDYHEDLLSKVEELFVVNHASGVAEPFVVSHVSGGVEHGTIVPDYKRFPGPLVAAAEKRHASGLAADLSVGDVNGDGRIDLHDGLRVAQQAEEAERSGRVVPGGCGLYQDEQGRVWVHLDVSGEVDRWGAAAQRGGAVWPVRWSEQERDVMERCAALGLTPRRERPGDHSLPPPIADGRSPNSGKSQIANRKSQIGQGVRSLRLTVRKRPSLLRYDAGTRRFEPAPSLTVWMEKTPVRTYPLSLGCDPVGDKEQRGDYRTPEGDFYVCRKNARSRFFKALFLSYPNQEDAARGLADGLITQAEHDRIVQAIGQGGVPPMDTALGGDICIHGGGVGPNWTEGCLALTNDDVAELFALVPVGTRVRIDR